MNEAMVMLQVRLTMEAGEGDQIINTGSCDAEKVVASALISTVRLLELRIL
jgi:hypothetical protein